MGRADELSLLADSFDRAVTRRTPQLVTVVGEPGVGKTRLIREFRRLIDDRPDLVRWRKGRCLPYAEGVTFWAIVPSDRTQGRCQCLQVARQPTGKKGSAESELPSDSPRERLRRYVSPSAAV